MPFGVRKTKNFQRTPNDPNDSNASNFRCALTTLGVRKTKKKANG